VKCFSNTGNYLPRSTCGTDGCSAGAELADEPHEADTAKPAAASVRAIVFTIFMVLFICCMLVMHHIHSMS